MPLAQHIYALVYLTTFILSCSIYRSVGNIPNWVILFLPFSKRLHSIFVLRLFNDCWSVLAVEAAILAFQHNFYDTGILLFRWVLEIVSLTSPIIFWVSVLAFQCCVVSQNVHLALSSGSSGRIIQTQGTSSYRGLHGRSGDVTDLLCSPISYGGRSGLCSVCFQPWSCVSLQMDSKLEVYWGRSFLEFSICDNFASRTCDGPCPVWAFQVVWTRWRSLSCSVARDSKAIASSCSTQSRRRLWAHYSLRFQS